MTEKVPNCDLCSLPMELCGVDKFRYSFRALFTHYKCVNEHNVPEKKDELMKFIKEKGLRWDKHYGGGIAKNIRYVTKTKCVVCEEISECYIENNVGEFVERHTLHLYRRIIMSYGFYYKNNLQKYYFSLMAGKKMFIYNIAYERDPNNIVLSRVYNKLPEISRVVMYSCDALILTYKRTDETKRRCICCDDIYSDVTCPELIYNHFIKCLKTNRELYINLNGVHDMTDEEKEIHEKTGAMFYFNHA